MRISLAALAVGAAAAWSASVAFGHTAVARCTGTQLAGAFSVVRGSGAAGGGGRATPGTRLASEMKLRPLSGRSVTRL